MDPQPLTRRRVIPPLVALGVIGVLYALCQEPALSEQEAESLASRFRFEKHPLPELSGYARKYVRDVHPSLRHINAAISFVGAAAALADLDGDGRPNDLVLVDPRIDQVMVAPVPGTGNRYEPFVLHPSPLPYDPATMAPMGALVGDFNEDGLADVLVYYWGRSPVLFLQQGDASSQDRVVLTRERFIPQELVEPYQVWYTSAVTQADLDGDGHVDLIVGNYFPDDARVLDAAGSGVEVLPQSLCRAFNGGRKRLLLWTGGNGGSKPSARFRVADGGLTEEVIRGWTFGIGAADLDGDLLPEIYFVHDWGPDRLLHNRSQPGRLDFVELRGERGLTTPRSLVLGGDSFGGMGIDFGDVNGDGWPDIIVTNIVCPSRILESNFLFLSTGEPERMKEGIAPYRDASGDLGVARGGWGWDVRLADFDNDGVLEVFQAAGFAKGSVSRWPEMHEWALMNSQLSVYPRSWHRLEPGDDVAGSDHNSFFVRAADGRFYDLAPRLGLAEPMRTRGIALADVDGDGRLDFVTANNWEPSFFFRNTAPNPGAFLGLKLQLPVGSVPARATSVRPGQVRTEVPSRPAIGASAKIHLPDGRILVGQVDGGTGHSGKRAPELHFGLGRLDASEAVRVDLRWRGVDGQIRAQALNLKAGWHTILLGEPREGDAP